MNYKRDNCWYFACSVMLLFLSPVLTHGQMQQPQVGKPFEYTFAGMVHYPTRTANVSDFKGKLLMLDFWNTGCASCVESWPKLLELQKKYDKQIQIVLVNAWQDEATVGKVIAARKQKTGVNMTLPMLCGDTVLDKMFPYPAVPKVVWIDQHGIYRSFTNGNYLNEHTIAAILNKEPLDMYQLAPTEPGKSANFNYENSKLKNYRDPFFVNGNGTESGFMPLVSQSVLTGRIDGLMRSLWKVKKDTVRGFITVTFHGPIGSFYQVAYNDKNFLEDHVGTSLERLMSNRCEWNVMSDLLPYNSDNDFIYAYQLTMPLTSRRRLQNMIKLDLNKYFGLEARIEKRPIKSWVLSVTDTALLRAKSGKEYAHDSAIRKFRSTSELIRDLEYNVYAKSPYPILDETGFVGPIGGFRFNGDPFVFHKELQTCGLSFRLEERLIDMLVVDEPTDYVFPEDLKFNSARKVAWVY